MNCRRVEKLIPLYVEGDLASRIADRVGSHLERCGRCNWLADEYKQSQSWLRSSEAPAFDEEFLADVKRDVLKGISNTRPPFTASLLGSVLGGWMQQWNRRQVLALGGALMIIFGVLVLYLYQTRANTGRAESELARQTHSDAHSTGAVPDLTPATKPAPGADFGVRPDHKKSRPTVRAMVRALLSQRAVEKPPFSVDDNSSGAQGPDKQLVSDVTFESGDMLRIEIQTSDPNIRIIWFAPKEAGVQPAILVTDTKP